MTTETKAWQFAPFSSDDDGRPVVSVDPGLRTGVAVLMPDGNVWGCEAQWHDAMMQVQIVLSTLMTTHPLVVCEAFIVTATTAQKSAAPWSLEGIGCTRFLTRRFGGEFKLQTAADAKRFSTNPRLKAQGWYLSTPGGHVNDALRHLYLALANQGRLTPPAGVR